MHKFVLKNKQMLYLSVGRRRDRKIFHLLVHSPDA